METRKTEGGTAFECLYRDLSTRIEGAEGGGRRSPVATVGITAIAAAVLGFAVENEESIL